MRTCDTCRPFFGQSGYPASITRVQVCLPCASIAGANNVSASHGGCRHPRGLPRPTTSRRQQCPALPTFALRKRHGYILPYAGPPWTRRYSTFSWLPSEGPPPRPAPPQAPGACGAIARGHSQEMDGRTHSPSAPRPFGPGRFVTAAYNSARDRLRWIRNAWQLLLR